MEYSADFWNERYDMPEYIYGKSPNEFLVEQLTNLQPGKILLPADGEGRNGVYAAENGWEVFAFDQSVEGQNKAQKLAAEREVTVHYAVADALDIQYENEQFDCLAMIYANFPFEIRSTIHKRLLKYLRPGGILIFESFGKEQLEYQKKYNSGGPKKLEMLFSEEELRKEFSELEISLMKTQETELREGSFHEGLASVIRMVAKKK